MWLLSALFFLVGSFYLVYSFYPENYGSTTCYDMMTCTTSVRRRKPAFLDAYTNEDDDEESCHFRDVGKEEEDRTASVATGHIIKKE